MVALSFMAVVAVNAGAGEATSSERALRERVDAYWQARTNANLHAAYPYYEPAFRARYTADAFARNFRRLNRFAPEFQGIVSVTIDADHARAEVKVKLRTAPAVLDGRELISVTKEVWLLQDGTWWKEAEPLLPSL